jgi:hypothetical protein
MWVHTSGTSWRKKRRKGLVTKLAVIQRIQTKMKEPVPVDPCNHYLGPVEEGIVRDVIVRAEVEEAMPVRTHVEDATPYDSWVRLRTLRATRSLHND